MMSTTLGLLWPLRFRLPFMTLILFPLSLAAQRLFLLPITSSSIFLLVQASRQLYWPQPQFPQIARVAAQRKSHRTRCLVLVQWQQWLLQCGFSTNVQSALSFTVLRVLFAWFTWLWRCLAICGRHLWHGPVAGFWRALQFVICVCAWAFKPFPCHRKAIGLLSITDRLWTHWLLSYMIKYCCTDFKIC